MKFERGNSPEENALQRKYYLGWQRLLSKLEWDIYRKPNRFKKFTTPYGSLK